MSDYELARRVEEAGRSLYLGLARRPVLSGRFVARAEAAVDEFRTRRSAIAPTSNPAVPLTSPAPEAAPVVSVPLRPPSNAFPLANFMTGVQMRLQSRAQMARATVLLPALPYPVASAPVTTQGAGTSLPLPNGSAPVPTFSGFKEIGSRAPPMPYADRMGGSLEQARLQEEAANASYSRIVSAGNHPVVARQGRPVGSGYVDFSGGR